MNFDIQEDLCSAGSQVIPSEELNQPADGLSVNGSGHSSGYYSATPQSCFNSSRGPHHSTPPVINNYYGSITVHHHPGSLEHKPQASNMQSPMDTTQGHSSGFSLLQKTIREHAPELQDGMNPDILLSHLVKRNLVSRDDIEIIANKDKTTRERNMHILTQVPFRDSGACKRFVSCLEEATEHPRHGELVQILRNHMDQLRRCKPRPKKPCRRKHPLSLVVTSSSDTASEPEARETRQKKMQTNYSQDEPSYMKLQWLEESVEFETQVKPIMLTSKTNYTAERRILDYDTLCVDGVERILILCNDCLLLLKPMNSKHNFKWFTDCKFTAKMPLLLHVLEAEKDPDDTDSFILRDKSQGCNEIHLQAHNTIARDFWIKAISDEAKKCKVARAECSVPMWNRKFRTPSMGLLEIHLTILDALVNASALPAQSDANLFCSVRLVSRSGTNRLSRRTHTVGVNIERTAHASWNTEELVMSSFKKTDGLEIRVMRENLFSPNDIVCECKLGVSKLTDGPERVHEMNVPLLQSEHQECGMIRIALTTSYM